LSFRAQREMLCIHEHQKTTTIIANKSAEGKKSSRKKLRVVSGKQSHYFENTQGLSFFIAHASVVGDSNTQQRHPHGENQRW